MPDLQRPELTQKQIELGERAGIITAAKRAGRETIETYPIDDHPPDMVADRDDGIFVEARARNAGYRVHVTIADVAAHIPIYGQLADAPRERAFTRYLPDMVDSMFPKITEERMSLENNKERLGILVSIDLDANFRPVHTEFKRVITRAHSLDYALAGQMLQTDPHLQLMTKIADGLQKYYFGEANAAVNEHEDKSQKLMNVSPDQRKIYRTVGCFMMLANCEIAGAFAPSSLAFVYRNFDGTKKNKEGKARANYDTKPSHHLAMTSGQKTLQYCHATSPLRRAPDFWVGHMMHYAMDTMDLIETMLKKAHPTVDAEALHYALWQHKEDILANLSKPTPMQATLVECLYESGISTTVEGASQSLSLITRELVRRSPPITRKVLQNYLDVTNALNWNEELAQAAVKRNEKLIERVENYSRSPMHHLTKDDFSHRLSDAAETGRLPTTLMEEALQRIHSGNFNHSRDAYNVLLVASYPQDERWLQLKRAICTAIKHDPASVRGVFTLAHNAGLLPESQVLDVETTLRSHGDQSNHGEPEVHAAIIMTQSRGNGSFIAPPFYSIGHDPRSALSHARYSFLEHAAFGQLQSVNQTSIPNLLYAQLEKHEMPKEEILKHMLEQLHADIDVRELTNKIGKPVCVVTISGGEVEEPIRIGHVGETPEEARVNAIGRLLRDDGFKYATRYKGDIRMQAVFPRIELEKRCADANYELEILPAEEMREKGRNYFSTTVVLKPPYGPEERYTGRASNIKGSVNEACVHALKSHEWLIKFSERERGWNSDSGKDTTMNLPSAGIQL